MNKVIVIVALVWAFPTPSDQADCFPGQSYTFNWTYSSIDTRASTIWYHENVAIMSKDGEDPAEVVTGKGFDGRIAEDPTSNAGMILNDTRTNDTGIFRVLARFNSDPEFNEQESFDVSTDSESLVIDNGELWVNNKSHNVSSDILGETPFNLAYTLSICVVPIITISLTDIEPTICEAYICSMDVNNPGTVTISVYVPGGPPDGTTYPDFTAEAPTTTPSYTGTTTADGPNIDGDVSCKDNMACLIPAIVVPILVVVAVAVGVVVYICITKKKGDSKNKEAHVGVEEAGRSNPNIKKSSN